MEQVPDTAPPAFGSDADDPGAPVAGGRPRRHRWRRRLLRRLTGVAPIFISGALRLLTLTLRVRFVGAEELVARWARGEQVIVAFWHARVLMMPVAGRGQKLCIMNSQSPDGEMATRALERWGIRSVRGSATRGGTAGFLQLVRAFREGYHLAVVPDGPRGPECVAKLGVIHLARATGAPLFPVSFAASRQVRLGTWDRMVVPLPFARVVFHIGAPLEVPRAATPAAIEDLRLTLERRLNAATEAAERAVAAPGPQGA